MNHKWNDNRCTHCGIQRVKKEGVRLKGTYSKLGQDGCWYDVPIKEYFIGWLYTLNTGDVTFERPDCVRKNDDRVQSIPEHSEGMSGANSCLRAGLAVRAGIPCHVSRNRSPIKL